MGRGDDKVLHNMIQISWSENRTTSSSGGGNRPGPKAEYITSKRADVSGRALRGVESTFYDQTSRAIGTSASDSTGTFRIRRPENGTYTFRETKASNGYTLNPDILSFIVNGSDVIGGIYKVVDKGLKSTTTKLDGDSGLPPVGARFRIEKGVSGVADKGLETESEGGTEVVAGADGTSIYHSATPGLYITRKTEASQGYQLTDEVYEFALDTVEWILGEAVTQDGAAMQDSVITQDGIIIYNWEEKSPVKKIGNATTVYQTGNRFGKGTYHPGSGHRDTVGIGDGLFMTVAAAMTVLYAAGLSMYLRMKRKKEWSQGRKWMVLILILIPIMVHLAPDVIAEETDTLSVSGRIIYTSMEDIEPVLQTIQILARDDISGRERNVLLPLVSYHFFDKHWKGEFRLDLTVTDYNTGPYEAGGVRIEAWEGDIRENLTNHEAEILSQAGLDSEVYRIEQSQWNGEIYGRDGVLCRNLVTVGRKLVTDCIAVYGGETSRSAFLDDIERDDESGQIGYSGIDERYVVKNSVRPLFSGITAFVAGIYSVVLIAAVTLTMIKWIRSCGMAVTIPMFFAGVVFGLRFLVRTGLDYTDGRKGYRMVQDEAYGREVKGTQGGYAAEAVDINEGGYSDEMRYTGGRENPKGNSACGKSGPNEAALVSINPEHQFWLSVPGAETDCSVVQHEDNEYYLNHNFYQEQYISGCVFAGSSAVPLAMDNTAPYEHSTKDGSVFVNLKKYGEEASFREDLVIQVFYRGRRLEYPIFSCQLRHQSDAGAYGINFMEEEWLPYLGKMGAVSLYEMGIIPEGDEKLITLSTCYGKDQYLIMQALPHGM